MTAPRRRLIIRRPAFTFVAVPILGLGSVQRDDLQLGRNDSAEAPAAVADQDRIVVIRGTTPTRNNLFLVPNFRNFRSARPDGWRM